MESILQVVQSMQSFFSAHLWLAFSIRIVFAGLCGAFIGLERSKRFKEAGIRTLCIVACASALLMILSKYSFTDLSAPLEAAGVRSDPTRIAAQIVSGIGFLGAGVIFRTSNSVRGLTTAACIWVSASVGMSIGCGMYYLGLFTTLVVALFQWLFHRFTAGADGYTICRLCMTVENDSDVLKRVKNYLSEQELHIVSTSIRRNGRASMSIELSVRMSSDTGLEELLEMMHTYPEIETIAT